MACSTVVHSIHGRQQIHACSCANSDIVQSRPISTRSRPKLEQLRNISLHSSPPSSYNFDNSTYLAHHVMQIMIGHWKSKNMGCIARTRAVVISSFSNFLRNESNGHMQQITFSNYTKQNTRQLQTINHNIKCNSQFIQIIAISSTSSWCHNCRNQARKATKQWYTQTHKTIINHQHRHLSSTGAALWSYATVCNNGSTARLQSAISQGSTSPQDHHHHHHIFTVSFSRQQHRRQASPHHTAHATRHHASSHLSPAVAGCQAPYTM